MPIIDLFLILTYTNLMNFNKNVSELDILILEDDLIFQMIIKNELDTIGVRSVTVTSSLEELRQAIKVNTFDLAYLDVYLEDKPQGVKALSICNINNINAYMLSASNEEIIIEETVKNNCLSFLSKSHLKENIKESILDYCKDESEKLSSKKLDLFFENEWITSDLETIEKIKKLLQFDWQERPVLITGDTGVGKSSLLKKLHSFKYGESTPFIEFNSGGKESDSTLTDVELFGAKKGAYTGAENDKIGKFTLSRGGTLFFDEIGNISKSTQEKLIKSIDEKTYSPIGSNKVHRLDSAFVFATLKNLDELLESGQMKRDFYARISGFNLEIKPLKERRDDITLIIHNLMKKEKRKFILTEEAKRLIYNYDWPFNVRELISEFQIWKVEAKANRYILGKEQLSHKIKTNYNPLRRKKNNSFLSQSALNQIKKHGYQAAIDMFHIELINEIQKNPGFFNLEKSSFLQIEKKIGIPRRTYKKLLDNYEGQYAKGI